MPQPFGHLPRALRDRALFTRLGDGVPALVAHPDERWQEPGARVERAPAMIWMHGRTVRKELDPGRYLRWVRSGIAAVTLDLPAHGEREDVSRHGPEATLGVVEEAVGEIDGVMASLKEGRLGEVLDTSRLGIGGMSAGGMVTLARLCEAHPFTCAAVESTGGDFSPMKGRAFYHDERVHRLSPIHRIEGWRPIPLLALHSEKDEWLPVACIRNFVEALRERYEALGAEDVELALKTWPETGAPHEHSGFGRVSNEAKTLQVEFLGRCLLREA
jgi:dienelactone hydrolase